MDNHANKPIWIRASVLVFRATAFTVLILICSGCAPMYQYENPYFIANSSASKKNTLAVLTNLEMFRAAVMQVANLRVPDSAAKTQVLIFRSKKKFATFGMGSNVGGFAWPYDGQFFIVVPSSGSSPWMARVVRHEFSHVLLGHRNFRYPQWYNEGFAQLVSTIRFRNKDTSFVFGEVPNGFDFESGSKLDWNTIISEGFDTHAMSETEARVAYQQSWLLAHYVTLGNNFGNTPKLLNYFQMIDGGEPSLAAFERAFGMDGNDLWTHELRPYSNRLLALRYDYDPDTLRTDFQRSKSDAAAVQSLVDQLRARTIRLTEKRGLFYGAESKVPFTGLKISVHPNGQKSQEGNFVNGELGGLVTQWHANGQKAAEGDFIDGKQSGLWISWHENGQKSEEGNFVNGELGGLVTQWHANGQKAAEGDFIDGKQSGLWISWHENGQKSQEGNFVNGKNDGPMTIWYAGGQQTLEGNWVNGKQSGRWVAWHENGQKAVEGEFIDGKQSGLWISWHENGQTEVEGNFVNGELDGLMTQWHANGRKEVEATFLEGEMKSGSEWWDENGNMKKPDSIAELNIRAAE